MGFNGWETGTDGTAITVANSDDAGGTAVIAAPSNGGGGAGTYRTAAAVVGDYGIRLTTVTNGQNQLRLFDDSVTSSGTYALTTWFDMASLPASSVRIAFVRDSAGAFQGEWRINSAGNLTQHSGTGSLLNTSAATVVQAGGTIAGVGLKVLVYSATVGQLECKAYAADGSVLETLTSAANLNTLRGGGASTWVIGVCSNNASMTLEFDETGTGTDYPTLPTSGTEHAGTAVANLGAAAATSTGTVEHPASSTANLGALAAAVSATVDRPATATAALGALAATSTATVDHPATATGTLGALAAASSATVDHPATAAAALGALTAAAVGTAAAPGAEHAGTATVNLGALTAPAAGVVDHPATGDATLGALVASAAGSVSATPATARATSTPTVTAGRTSTIVVTARRTSAAVVTAARTSTPTVGG